MVTQQTNKELTVEQYEFYKTKENPMTDAQIIKIYDLDNNKLYAWKKKHNLIGKNYGMQATSNLKVYKKSDVKEVSVPTEPIQNEAPLLKGNKVEQERRQRILEGINDINSYSANKNVKEKIDSRKEKSAPIVEKVTHSDSENVSTIECAEKSAEVSNVMDQLKSEIEEYRKKAEWLECRHKEDAQKVVDLKQQLQASAQRFTYLELMKKANADVIAERHRQNEKYGYQRHEYGKWLAILAEEFGEVAQAMQKGWGWGKETDAHDLYMELIHTSAVALGFAEQVMEERMKV